MSCSVTDWTLHDQLSLLEAAERAGPAWAEVARLLPGPARSPAQLRSQFESVFVEGETDEPALSAVSFAAVTACGGAGWRDTAAQPWPVPTSRGGGAGGGAARQVGYCTARSEFTVEWDNSAERELCLMLGDWKPGPQTTKLELELGLVVAERYRRRLAGRARAHRAVRDGGLLGPGRHPAPLQGRLAGLERCRQLLPPHNWDILLAGLQLEEELRGRVRDLQAERREGLQIAGMAALRDRLAAVRRQQAGQLGGAGVRDWCGAVRPDPAPRFSRPLDISRLAGAERLAEEERELCTAARLPPATFLRVRGILEEQCAENSGLSLAQARQTAGIDVNKTRKIYDFLLSNGTIWSSRSSSVM